VDVNARALLVVEGVGERALGSALAEDLVLVGGEEVRPLVFGEGDAAGAGGVAGHGGGGFGFRKEEGNGGEDGESGEEPKAHGKILPQLESFASRGGGTANDEAEGASGGRQPNGSMKRAKKFA